MTTTALAHTPLDVAAFSPAAQKALGPGPGRMMASRGLVPLPPSEQAMVLYQLSIDADAAIAQAARGTAAGLPDKLLAGALADGRLDPRVLDFFAGVAGKKLPVFDALVENAAIADETIAKLAASGGAREVDRIAANEQRLLRHPEIIAAMYLNKAARMSTVDRVVELAVRNHIRVPGLAVWDEVARALGGGTAAPPATAAADAEADALFAYATEALGGDDRALTTGNPDEVLDDDGDGAAELELAPTDDVKNVLDPMSIPGKIRLATLGNAFARSTLIRDPVKLVAVAAIKSPGVNSVEARRYASNQSLSDEVIRYIATRKDWTKDYGVRIALCRNPKTPVPDSSRLLPFLRDKELQNLVKSRGIPSALVAQARKMIMQRRGGSGDKK